MSTKISPLPIKYCKNNSSKNSRLMLFDLACSGHHPNYIRYLVKYFCEQKKTDDLYIIVSPEFIDIHNHIISIPRNYSNQNIKFISISNEEYLNWKNQKKAFIRILKEWIIFCDYAKKLNISHALLMYFDHFQLPLAIGMKSPCSFSGIYFRPSFHYKEFENYNFSFKDKLRALRQRLILSIVLKNPQLKKIFCLDPYVVKHINRIAKIDIAVHLPDPIDHREYSQKEADDFREKMGIESSRITLLLFGKIDSRKGIYKIVEAFKLLPSEVCAKICLLIVGNASKSERQKIDSKIKSLVGFSNIQIITDYNYISDKKVGLYFKITDLVLALYQNHVGMSGILLWASAFQKPVLSSNYGLMGQIVKDKNLGLAINSESSEDIKNTIKLIVNQPIDDLCNSNNMQNFTQANSVNLFAKTLFEGFFFNLFLAL